MREHDCQRGQVAADGRRQLAASAIRIDREIDRKEREIESMCLKLLLQQQPVASDLRLILRGTENDHGY